MRAADQSGFEPGRVDLLLPLRLPVRALIAVSGRGIKAASRHQRGNGLPQTPPEFGPAINGV